MTKQVVIVGCGPAGMAAAISAHQTGAQVMVIDEAQREGGQIYRQGAPELGLPKIGLQSELARKSSLINAFDAIKDKIECRFGTVAHSLYDGPELQIANEHSSERIKADAVIIATGVSERTLPFPGWTLPGVMYAGAAQSLLKSQGIRPGDKIAVSGTGALPIAVAAQMAKAGGKIEALALTRSPMEILKSPSACWAGRTILSEGVQYLWQLARRGVFYKSGYAVVRAHGETRLEQVTLAPLNADGTADLTKSKEVQVDLLLLNHGFTANTELVRMAGVEHRFDPIRGGWLPIVDDLGKTSLDGIYVAGDGAGLRGAINAEAEGHIVGQAAAASVLGKTVSKNTSHMRQRARQERFQSGLRRTLVLPKGSTSWADDDTTVCRCEGVTVGQLNKAKAEGHTSLDAIKRNTRCGMGWCGGRTCLQNAAKIVEGENDAPAPRQMRARPVARPVKLGALANQSGAE